MRASSQRHLASARGSLLLAWLPRPGRGARSPPALGRRSAPVSRSRLCGEVLDPPRLGVLGGMGQACSAVEPRQRGCGVGLPEKGLGSSSAVSSLGKETIDPFSPFVPPVPAFPPVPRARPAFPGVPPQLPPMCLLAQLAAVLVSQRGPAVPRVPQPGTRSRCGGEHKATALMFVGIEPQSWCWAPAGGFPALGALERCCGALLRGGAMPWHGARSRAGSSRLLGSSAGCSTHGMVSPGPQLCSWQVSPGQLEPWGRAGCSSHPGRLRCPGLSQRARGWGGACCCRKWGCIQPREGLKWHFWKGGGLRVPACCTVLRPRLCRRHGMLGAVVPAGAGILNPLIPTPLGQGHREPVVTRGHSPSAASACPTRLPSQQDESPSPV